MKQLITIISLIISSILCAQNAPSTLAVSGQSQLSVIPDITAININLNSVNMDYNSATTSLEKKSNALKSLLTKNGIKKEHITSEDFQIDKRYSYKNNSRVYEGYNAQLWIKLEFTNDNAFANKIMNAIASENTEAEVNISFKLSSEVKDSINDQLIVLAIENAKKKANIIAASTEQRILQVQKISYGVKENSGAYPTLNYAMEGTRKSSKTNFSITPKSQTLSTSITIYWLLSTK